MRHIAAVSQEIAKLLVAVAMVALAGIFDALLLAHTTAVVVLFLIHLAFWTGA